MPQTPTTIEIGDGAGQPMTREEAFAMSGARTLAAMAPDDGPAADDIAIDGS